MGHRHCFPLHRARQRKGRSVRSLLTDVSSGKPWLRSCLVTVTACSHACCSPPPFPSVVILLCHPRLSLPVPLPPHPLPFPSPAALPDLTHLITVDPGISQCNFGPCPTARLDHSAGDQNRLSHGHHVINEV